jgi:sec-independent protein translocase protein TatC
VSGPAGLDGEPSTVASEESGSSGGRRGGEERRMPFLEHLEELRRVLLDALWAVTIGTVAAWFVAEKAIAILVRPVGSLVFFGPAEALGLHLKVAFALGLVAAAPVVLFRLWSFVAPGLFPGERRFVGPLVASSVLLFLSGVLFAHFVLAPLTLRFLLSFQSDVLKPVLGAGPYFDFLFKLCLSFGVLFQMPIVLGALSWVGIVPPSLLLGRWREAVLIIFVIAAVLTPPDVISQVVMAGPLLVLYALSVAIAFGVAGRGRRAAAPATEGARREPSRGGPATP